MSRKEVRRDNPPALFLCPPLSSRTRCGHQVIPHPDAGFRDTDKITRKIHFSGPRITCGVTPFVMPPSMRSPSHPVPRCGIQRIPSSVIPSSNAAPWSCRLRCGHRSSRPRCAPCHPAPRCGIQEYPLFTPRETVRAVGMHGPCVLL